MEESGEGGLLDDFVSAPAVIISNYVRKWFPVTSKLTNAELNALQAHVRPLSGSGQSCFLLRDMTPAWP